MIYFVRVVASGDIYNPSTESYTYTSEVCTVEVVCDSIQEAKEKAVGEVYKKNRRCGTFRACIVAAVKEYHEDPFEYTPPSIY